MGGYRHYRRRTRQSTRALTAKFTVLAVVAMLLIGGLLAVQMAAGDDPALGPKAAAKAKKASTRSTTATQSTSSGSGIDPYSQAYGYGSSAGSGYSTQRSSPAPVTSSTS
jgi:uncharacterized protein YfaQ (DUF2300 family)